MAKRFIALKEYPGTIIMIIGILLLLVPTVLFFSHVVDFVANILVTTTIFGTCFIMLGIVLNRNVRIKRRSLNDAEDIR